MVDLLMAPHRAGPRRMPRPEGIDARESCRAVREASYPPGVIVIDAA